MSAERRARPTVRQVAELAGVSTATVSNALNDTGRLSEETRLRVLRVAHDLSYVPHASARARARGGTGILGLTMATHGDLDVPYTEIPYYGQLILAAIRAAHERGYLLVVLPASMTAWDWLTMPLDGIIHCEPRQHDPVHAILAKRDIPLVFAGRPLSPQRGDSWVDTDDGSALGELLDHFRQHGARSIAAVLPNHDDAYPAIVRAAYKSWCAGAGQDAIVASFDPDLTETAESNAIGSLLRCSPRPDAVFGVYNRSGSLILAAARELGVDVPRELAVACFSEDTTYPHLEPPVTTISLRPAEVGRASVEMLVGHINGRRGLRRQVLIPAILEERESSQMNLTSSL